MGRYEDFDWCTRKALDHALALLDKKLETSDRESLIERYNDLESFPDAAPALQELLDRGHVLAVLSNGAPAMLGAILDATGLRRYFDEVMSVDEVRAFKPSPRPYHLAATRLDRLPSQVRLVSGAFEPDGSPPDIVIRSLTDLPAALGPGTANIAR
ncbi:HAD-IA family hydrolase [Actinomadura sp. WMMA1423]|uniref:HAD-IA family hydrolase n=1 Tax=Actinomadura sp. WMMA1423 TaxID=2591108 RepID=UPI00143DF165|nr:HAD-IA family hydrolase [Actinomadura sp. WMMA1423]